MANFEKNEMMDGKMFVHTYSGIEKVELNTKVHNLFTSSGYKLIEGDNGNGVYEKGNRAMRILFGAFVKYFKFDVSIQDGADNKPQLKVDKKTSGMSGGAIGVSQVKKELKRVAALAQTI